MSPLVPCFLTPEQEALAFLDAYKASMGVDQIWSVISSKWFRLWQQYSGVTDLNKRDIAPSKGSKPVAIDNSNLSDPAYPKALKSGIQENEDYILLNNEAAQLLFNWYQGGPRFDRKVVSIGRLGETRIDLFPAFLVFYDSDEKGSCLEETKRDKEFPGSKTVSSIMQSIADEKRENKSNLRFWIESKKDEQPGADSDYEMVSHGDTDSSSSSSPPPSPSPPPQPEWTLISEVEMESAICTFSLAVGTKILIEKKKSDGSWCRDKDWRDFKVGDELDAMDSYSKWYGATIKTVEDTRVYVKFEGYAEKYNEWIDRASDKLAPRRTHSQPFPKPRDSSVSTGYGSGSSSGYSYNGYYSSYNSNEEGTPDHVGAVGLRNLGNTCFMNSVLQCLSHTPYLTPFFKNDEYLKDINRDNPLGWKGKVAEEYGSLIKDLWSDKYTVVTPRSFKQVIGEFQPRFSGYNQQDSSELLSFLLDGLHEDLNLVKQKPVTQPVESNNRPDEIVAQEAWETYLKRNQSVIVNTMQGQYKSKLVCPDANCGRVSITFDPFLFLSVPLPQVNDHVQEINLVSADPSKPTSKHRVVINKYARIFELKEAVGKLTNISARRLVVVELYTNSVYKYFADDDSVSDMGSRDEIFVYEVPAMELGKDMIPVSCMHRRSEPNSRYDPSYTYSSKYNIVTYGLPAITALPSKQAITGKQIYAAIGEALRSHARDPSQIPQFVVRQLDKGGRNCFKCGYSCSQGCLVENNDDVLLENVLEETVSYFSRQSDRGSKISFAVEWTDENEYNKDKPIHQHSQDGHIQSMDGASLQECIRLFTKEETLSETDPWYCSGCKQFQCATKKFDLWRLPKILIIHLKRFSYTRINREKITMNVDFPLEGLDLSEFCGAAQESCLYDLYAVSNHMGGLGGGHYTAYCKNLSNGQWYCHDDSRVSSCNANEVRSPAAYVLFYKRREPAD